MWLTRNVSSDIIKLFHKTWQNEKKRSERLILSSKVIGKRLVNLRGNKTQEMVAKDIGISTSALSMYETGERIPRDTIKVMIAKYYGVSVQSIFFDD